MQLGVLLPLLALCAASCVTCFEKYSRPPDRPYNILIMLQCTTKSHLYIMMPLAKALAKRGHQITIVDTIPGDNPFNIENITFIYHNMSYVDSSKNNFIEIGSSYYQMVTHAVPNVYKFAGEFWDMPEILELYKQRDKIDLVIMDQFLNEIAYPFAQDKPFISSATNGLEHMYSGASGNFLNPSYNTFYMEHFKHPMSLPTRVFNFLMYPIMPIARYLIFTLPVQIQISRRFPDMPSLMEIERNLSLSLLYSHSSIFGPSKLLQSQIEIGGILCQPGKPLPKDLADFLEGDQMAIYVSFGQAFSAKFLPASWRKEFLETLYSLPYKIIWTFDEDIPNLPKNIYRANWMPQQDILAHPNVKLFISHGGLSGIYEGIYHNTIIVALPIVPLSDQRKNCHRLQNHGLGVCLEWPDMTSSILTNTIIEVLHDPKYATKVKEVSSLMKDQPETPLERAVYWTEYVVRHNGAPQLRSPELDLYWFQLLNLDVVAALALMLYALYRLCKWSLRLIFRKKHKTD